MSTESFDSLFPLSPYIVISTYNESENIGRLLNEIFEFCPPCHVVVVDDNSPDETWKIVKEMSQTNPRIHLLHRLDKRGRGSAGVDGFLFALRQGADVIMEMDGDFSHHPRYLPDFMHAVKNYDLVLGSRFVQGGDDSDRGWVRQMITQLANIYVRFMFGIKIRDCSSGYRAFRREVLEHMDLPSLNIIGPEIIQQLLYRISRMNYRILEIPIVFTDRKQGKTKLSHRQLMNGFLTVLKLRLSNIPKTDAQVPEHIS